MKATDQQRAQTNANDLNNIFFSVRSVSCSRHFSLSSRNQWLSSREKRKSVFFGEMCQFVDSFSRLFLLLFFGRKKRKQLKSTQQKNVKIMPLVAAYNPLNTQSLFGS